MNSVTPSKIPLVPIEVEGLVVNAKHIMDLLELLENRLGPVLRREDNGKAVIAVDPMVPTTPPLVSELRTVNENMAIIRRRLEYILDTLEL